MKLKIFIPDYNAAMDKKKCVPLFYAFPLTPSGLSKAIQDYGEWITSVELVDTIEQCDIVTPLYYTNYYYAKKQLPALFKMNESAIKAGKLTVCWSNGDEGITPPLKDFHLYRCGGYLHKNNGNQFCYPSFFPDPVDKYFNGILPLTEYKTTKPVIGFCGQGKAGLYKLLVDISRHIYQCVLKVYGSRYEDLERIQSTAYNRSQLLDQLKKSAAIITNFTRHRQYRAGAKNKVEKEDGSIAFYENMRSSQYVFCYRGKGNYSVRLYETLACGRIPFMIRSDDNLPFANLVNWKMFPQINYNTAKDNMEGVLVSFHEKLDDTDFKNLQLKAREIWKEYLSYQGFMKNFVKKYGHQAE